MKLTIRMRLTIIFSAIFSILLVLSFALVLSILNKNLMRDVQTEMAHDGHLIAEIFKEELRLNALDEFQSEIHDLGLMMLILDKEGKVVVQSENWDELGVVIDHRLHLVSGQQPIFKPIQIDGRPFALFCQSITIPNYGPYSLYTIRSSEMIPKMMGSLLKWTFITGPLMIILSAIAGYVFSRRALAPVDRIREKASSIYAHNLSQRIELPAQRDELTLLIETLNAMLDRIQSSYDQLKMFTADASHELRIPLTSLRGNIEVALRKNRTLEEYKAILVLALSEAEHLSRLTQDLLLLAQSDSGCLKICREQCDIDEFLRQICSEASILAKDQDVQIVLGNCSAGSAWIDIDKIRQLLLNLVDNAIKYNNPSGLVKLSSERDKDNIFIVVADTGIGISPDDQERIFDRFYRVDKARSRKRGGTGLGLAIARSIALAHNGSLTVKSVLGQGSQFSLRLPCKI